MKKLVNCMPVFFGILLVFILFAGTIFCPAAMAEKTKLVYWTGDDRPDAINARNYVFEEYKKVNPNVEFEVVIIPYRSYNTKFVTAKATNTLPDLVMVNDTLAMSYYKMGVLEPVTAIINKDKDNYAKADLEQISSDGQYWAIPWWSVPHCLWYRKDLFAKDGIEPPKTWDDFLAAGKKYTVDKDGDGKIDQWGLLQANKTTNAEYILADLCATNQPIHMFDQNGNYDFESENLMEVLRFIETLRDTIMYPGGVTLTLIESRPYRVSGLGVMSIGSGSFLSVIEKENIKDQWGVAPIPMKKNPGATSLLWTLAAVKGPKSAEALKFLDFWAQREIMKEHFKLQVLGWIPAQKSVVAAADYLSSARIAPWKDYLEVLAKIHENRYAFGTEYGPNEYYGELRAQLVTANLISRILVDKWSPEKALDEFSKKVQRLVDSKKNK